MPNRKVEYVTVGVENVRVKEEYDAKCYSENVTEWKMLQSMMQNVTVKMLQSVKCERV